MRSLGKTVLAAAVGLVAVAGLATAEIKTAHVLTLRLPDGSIERIRYLGDKPPQVSLRSSPAAYPGFIDVAEPFDPASPFADLERMSAAMDRKAAALLRQASQLQEMSLGNVDGFQRADLGRLPPGVRGYSMVSTVSGAGLCTRSVEYRSFGAGEPPKVVTRTSGNCGAKQDGDSASTSIASRRPSPPSLTQISYDGGGAQPRLVRAPVATSER